MSRHPKTTDLVMLPLFLTLFLPAMQLCLAQTAIQDKTGHSQGANDQYDAPANDMRLINSEFGFRLDALRKVMPEFPEEALKAGAQGTVVLSLYQDGEGNAANIKVVESPHPALTEAAIKAVKQWKWRRFKSGGIWRPILSKLSFRFIIEGGAGRVEDPVDDGKDGAFRNVRDIEALRLKATWPEESSRRVKQDSPD